MARLECACIAKKTSASSACTLYRGQLIASSARKLPIGIKKKVTIPSTTFWRTRRKHQVSEDFEKGAGRSRAFAILSGDSSNSNGRGHPASLLALPPGGGE